MSGAQLNILVVDDEPAIRRLLVTGLGTQGYRVTGAATGGEALAAVAAEPPDLVLLDLGLPDLGGQDLLRRWRDSGLEAPVVVLSSRTDEAGIVEALDLGADDYVTKPFGMNELVARIRVALRHRLQTQGERPLFRLGDLSVDLVRRIVRLGEEEVKLSPKEYDILRLLIQHAGKVLTHAFIMQKVWGHAQDVQHLRVFVRQLRQKLRDDPEQPRYIRTETGVGYRLKAPD
ncbi:response regulator transcription factor [Xanthobacter autotrophicus DSM 431]|uniref:response regulator n=1 Tax=Xanthobacter nonsaccharivorans TaxID=3119912 RepID=UPI00372B757E